MYTKNIIRNNIVHKNVNGPKPITKLTYFSYCIDFLKKAIIKNKFMKKNMLPMGDAKFKIASQQQKLTKASKSLKYQFSRFLTSRKIRDISVLFDIFIQKSLPSQDLDCLEKVQNFRTLCY